MAESKKTSKASKKAPAKSKSAAPKSTTTKTSPAKAPAKTWLKTVPAQSKIAPKETVGASERSKNPEVTPDSGIFTMILAIFIVAFVVLGGYVYSRQDRRAEIAPAVQDQVQDQSQPQSQDSQVPVPITGNAQAMTPPVPTPEPPVPTAPTFAVAKNVAMTPDLATALSSLQNVFFIEPDDQLTDVRTVSDVVGSQKANWDLFKHAALGDYVLLFKHRTILFRASTEQVMSVVENTKK